MRTTVVNRKTASSYDIYIGRPSKWGNPYKIGGPHPITKRPMTRADVLILYVVHLHDHPALIRDLPELKGQRLGCWCAPKSCHGHILAVLADA